MMSALGGKRTWRAGYFLRRWESAGGSGNIQRPTKRAMSKPITIARSDAKSILLPAVKKDQLNRSATQSKK
jgi:hypothetical protein